MPTNRKLTLYKDMPHRDMPVVKSLEVNTVARAIVCEAFTKLLIVLPLSGMAWCGLLFVLFCVCRTDCR